MTEKTILYIEDNPANLKLVAQIIRQKTNLKLLSAHEPFLGIELACTHKPDLILLDINLPGIDGFEVLKRLQSQAETQSIPVLAITANAMPKDVERGVKAGFKEYVTKPINVLELLATLDKYLG